MHSRYIDDKYGVEEERYAEWDKLMLNVKSKDLILDTREINRARALDN